jgi:hypothetical protein
MEIKFRQTGSMGPFFLILGSARWSRWSYRAFFKGEALLDLANEGKVRRASCFIKSLQVIENI